MEDVNSQKTKAEIYKLILSGKAFLNPMRPLIEDTKNKLTLFYYEVEKPETKSKIKLLIDQLEQFKNHTDEISGINLEQSKRILEILKLIEKNSMSHLNFNPYKSCFSSILDSATLVSKIKVLMMNINEYRIIKDDSVILPLVDSIIVDIISHIQSDCLAYENLKQASLVKSITESLTRVVSNTCANQIISKIQTRDLGRHLKEFA